MMLEQPIIDGGINLLKSVSERLFHYGDVTAQELKSLGAYLRHSEFMAEPAVVEAMSSTLENAESTQGGYMWAETMDGLIPGGVTSLAPSMAAMAFWGSNTGRSDFSDKMVSGIADTLKKNYLSDPSKLFLEVPNQIARMANHVFFVGKTPELLERVIPKVLDEGNLPEKELVSSLILTMAVFDKKSTPSIPSVIKAAVGTNMYYPQDLLASRVFCDHARDFSEEQLDVIHGTVTNIALAQENSEW